MSRPYQCDQCEGTQDEAMSFEIRQLTDEEDEHGNQIVLELHLCSAQCVASYAMVQLDFE